MIGLYEQLNKEAARLNRIVNLTEKRLQNVPDGHLHIVKCGKNVQYYHCIKGITGKNGKYIPKAEFEKVKMLAQKQYDQTVLSIASKRLTQIRKILKEYHENEIEQIFQSESPERQKLILPVEPLWEEIVKKWQDEEYIGKGFKEELPVIYSERGERVRSKSEKIIADYLFRNCIPYKYERPLYLKGYGNVYPDFTFLQKSTGREIYWEHEGRMDDPVYARRAINKISLYKKNEIFPGENLILTFETENTILNTDEINQIVCRYLS